MFHNFWSSNAPSMNFTSLGCAAMQFTGLSAKCDGLYAKTLRQLEGLSTKPRLLSGLAIIQQTLRQNDGISVKMTNNSSAKMSEMTSRASGLQIKCGLFL